MGLAVILEHDLFRKPVSTHRVKARGHAFSGSCSSAWAYCVTVIAHTLSAGCVKQPTQTLGLFGEPESTLPFSTTFRTPRKTLLFERVTGLIRRGAWLACQSLRCASRDLFALYGPCCVTCGAVILPDWQPYGRSFFPSGRCFAGAPTLANFKPGPQGPGFFCARRAGSVRPAIFHATISEC
jgi:hypothetical protein